MRSPTEEGTLCKEKIVDETTPLREEEEEKELTTETKIPPESGELNKQQDFEKDRVSPIDSSNIVKNKTELEKSDGEKTVIQTSTSEGLDDADSKVSQKSPYSSSREAQDTPLTKITSIRKETEKAKARFLESDI